MFLRDRPDTQSRRHRFQEAPARDRAEAVAIKEFGLDQDQRSRLLIQERA